MTLHERFVKTAKMYPKKIAIIDQATNKEITYQTALISSLILAKKIQKFDFHLKMKSHYTMRF